MYKGNISYTRWKEKPEVNRANHETIIDSHA